MRAEKKITAKGNEGLNAAIFKLGIDGLRAGVSFLLFGTLSVALNIPAAFAENLENVTGVITQEEVRDQRGVLRLKAKASLGLESNAYVWGSRDHVTTSTASGEPSLGYDSYTMTARLAASRIMKETEEWKWAEDFQVGASRKGWELGRKFTLAPTATLILPLTDYSRKYSLLDYGVSGRLTLKWDLNRNIRGLTLATANRVTRFEYATPVAFDGQSNEAWRVNTRLIADWEFVRTLSLGVLFGRTWAWSVKNNSFDRFEMEQTLSWQPIEAASLTIGHSRGGDVLRSDGNSNLALYDNRDSTFYLELGLAI